MFQYTQYIYYFYTLVYLALKKLVIIREMRCIFMYHQYKDNSIQCNHHLLSSIMEGSLKQMSTSWWLHWDKFWIPVTNISYVSFSNISWIVDSSSSEDEYSRCINLLNHLLKTCLFKSCFQYATISLFLSLYSLFWFV